MFNIIVDTETTSSNLLNRKCFDYPVVLIPNNKISAKPIPSEKLRAIQEVVGNEARLALDIIKFDPGSHQRCNLFSVKPLSALPTR